MGRGMSVEIRDVSVVRGGRAILDDVSFSVLAGEVAGLVGPSGSGKSTIIRMILGMITPDSGSVEIGPFRLPVGADERRRMAGMVAWIPQDAVGALDPEMTVERILLEGLIIHDRPIYNKAELLDGMLKPLGLGPEILSRRPRELSGGQAQRVAIARALSLKPSLIVADEPTSALDSLVQARVLTDLVHQARAVGATVIVVSHSLMVVSALCDTVTVIDAGRVVEYGDVAKVLGDPEHARTRELLDCEPRI